MVDDGSIEVGDGHAKDAAVVVRTGEETWLKITSGNTSASLVTETGALTVAGERQAAKRLGRIFSTDRIHKVPAEEA